MKTPPAGNFGSLHRGMLLGILPCLLLSGSVGTAGEWRVTPIRLELGRDAKSGVVTVINEARDKLRVQMKAFEWTQDAEGKDRYEETKELLFFPRIMDFDAREERILRAGVKIPAVAREKTYRLFIEEIPGPAKTEGVNVSIAIRFGVPVFVKPLKEEAGGEIGTLSLSGGIFSAPVKNTGNVHFVIRSILVKGKNSEGEEIFSKELSGWYLLAGASRVYATTLPQEVCRDVAGIDIEVKTEKFALNGKLVADKSMCLP